MKEKRRGSGNLRFPDNDQRVANYFTKRRRGRYQTLYRRRALAKRKIHSYPSDSKVRSKICRIGASTGDQTSP